MGSVYNPQTGMFDRVGMRMFLFDHVPNSSDYRYLVGSHGQDTTTKKIYILEDNTFNSAVWQLLSSTSIDFYESVLSIADASIAPPTEVSGDRYILDNSMPVHADWDGALSYDVVEFNGATWDAVTPTAGGFCYVEDVSILYVFDGTWQPISAAIPDATTVQKGILKTATNALAIAKASIAVALTPSNIPSIMSSPGETGNVTPASTTVTTLQLDPITAPAHVEGRMYYNSAMKAFSLFTDIVGTSLQVGEESWIRVLNDSGAQINDSLVAYISGASGGFPTIELAQGDSDNTANVIGVVTEDIADSAQGYITTFGLVRNVNTSGFSAGDELWLSPTVAGAVVATKPDCTTNHIVRIGYVGVSDAVNGTFHVCIRNGGDFNDIHGYDKKKNGFFDPANEVDVSFVNGTRTLTIAPQATNFVYWSEGNVYNKTSSENIIIPNTEGSHYIYYDGATLSQTMTFSEDLILKYAFIACVYWDAANAKQILLAEEYRHGADMAGDTHHYLHETVGFRLQAGGELTDILADQAAPTNVNAQFGCGATIAWDEDAEFSHTARTSVSNISFYYKSGADVSNIWRVDETASFGVITTGTGRAAYNFLTGGNWTQAEVPNNDFVLAHVFTFNDSTRKYGVLQGENSYNTLSNARDGAEVEILSMTIDGLPAAELKFLGTIIYQTADSYVSSTTKSRIRTTDTGDDYIDLRDFGVTRSGVSGTLTAHGSLSGLLNDDHTQYLLANGTRALAGAWNMASYALTNINIDTGTIKSTNTQVLVGAKTLIGGTDPIVQLLDPNGSSRTVTLNTTAVPDGAEFIIVNIGTFDAVARLTVEVEGGTGIDNIYSGSVKHFSYDGAAWYEVSSGSTAAGTINRNTSYGNNSTAYDYGTAVGAEALATDKSAAIGYNSEATNQSSAVGYKAEASNQSHAKGFASVTSRTGEEWRCTDFDTPNAYGYGGYGMSAQTTDATVTELLLAGTDRLILQASSAIMFKISCIAYDVTNDDAHIWEITGGIKRDASNNTSLVGVVKFENELYDAGLSAAVLAVTADDTNEALAIKFTGIVGKTIRTQVKIETSECRF